VIKTAGSGKVDTLPTGSPTGLPNRGYFAQALSELIRSAKNDDRMMAVLMVDLQRFSRVNRLYGYEVGDTFLKEIHGRLLEFSPSGAVVARVGNDEFAIALTQLPNINLLTLAANKVLRIIEQSLSINGHQHSFSANIGTAVFPDHGTDAEDLMLAADRALAEAKKSNVQVVFSETAESLSAGNWDMERALHKAIEDNDLEFNFQPKVDLRTGKPSQVEALLRWRHEEKGDISPELFVPIAEQSGKLVELTRWVLNNALRCSREWPGKWGALSVAVNISAHHVHYSELSDLVNGALRIWGKLPESLILEITESAIMEDKESAFANLSSIKDTGVKISIDDFGTGYSSLEYFKTIPANELKIDKSFVANMFNDPADQNIVEVIITLAHKFGLSVVAEGVEDQRTLRKLTEMGCDYAQGYYLSRPLPQEEFMDWLENYQAEDYFSWN
jgi:diguanylate cyclase (GGDEF)-like protein